jgi:hypothetical protein
MENMKKEFLIGGSKDFENIFTMEIEIRDWNGYPEFSASFNEGELFNVEERNENAEDWYSTLFDEMDAETKLKYLQDGDITKQDWIEECIRYEYDYRERVDCSCTDYEFTKDNLTYNFETVGCGQHDPRDYDYFIPVNSTVKKLLEFWDKHHLKEITEKEFEELKKLCKNMESFEDIEEEILKRVHPEVIL